MKWANVFHAYQPPGWDPAVVRRVMRESYLPFFRWLERHGDVRVTVNFAGSLLEQLLELRDHDLLPLVRRVVERGQVELVHTAAYHPLLPLVPHSALQRQFRDQQTLLEHIGAVALHGAFVPEMAYAPHLASALLEAGASWVLLDEIALTGKLGEAAIDMPYRCANAPLDVVFRNRILSDYLFFSARLDDPQDFWRVLHEDGRSEKLLITAMDLENLGHHRRGLDGYWQALVTDPRVETATISEVMSERDGVPERCSPLPASWATREADMQQRIPFPLWQHPENPLHQLQWQLTSMVTGAAAAADDAHLRLVDEALPSDQYWWASATPWWDVGIIERGARRLFGTLQALSPEPAQLTAGKELSDAIVALAHEWHANGTAEKRRRAFLTEHPHRARMAGEEL